MGNKFEMDSSQESYNRIEELSRNIQFMFPEMSQSVVGKNLAFIELLEEYDNDTIHGISDFLDEKDYEDKGIKYMNGAGIRISEEDKNNIDTGKYLIGIKKFYEVKESGENQIDSYLIIAKKKDHPMVDAFKDLISNFVNKTVNSNT